MTFTPTKKAQKQWVKKHLNNGRCYRNERDHEEWMYFWCPEGACWAAMDWLSKSDISTLEEAWEQCPKPEWLAWTLDHMQPNKEDERKLDELVARILKEQRGGSDFLRMVDYRLNGVKRTCLDFPALEWVIRGYYRGNNKWLCDRIREIWGNPWRMKKC